MAVYSGKIVGQELCKALGLDPNMVLGLRIECNAGGVAQATIERALSESEIEDTKSVLEHYDLIKKEDSNDKEGEVFNLP